MGGAIGAEATTNTLPVLIGNIVNALLTVLGIVFMVLIVYSGFLYLTDAGGGEKVKKAKSIMTQSIIGLVIILAAYAISRYVISALTTAAT